MRDVELGVPGPSVPGVVPLIGTGSVQRGPILDTSAEKLFFRKKILKKQIPPRRKLFAEKLQESADAA
jgi:hypothetical protein